MNMLFCCEFYYPSQGGVQEVMRQIAERMVRRGHNVTVATTKLANRDSSEHKGVKIVEFGVSGNLVRGMEGEVERYREFVHTFDCNVILIKAAQQWTFDALWPDYDQIQARKVLIPCGFSGLFERDYQDYFKGLPEVLRKFDHLIFYAEHYRDIDFARQHQIEHFSILANGACEIEFGVQKDLRFRYLRGIPEDSVVLLTVGSMTGVKGHRELLEAFSRLKTSRRHVTFIMNGNLPPKPQITVSKESPLQEVNPSIGVGAPNFRQRMAKVYELEGWEGVWSRICHHTSRLYLSKKNELIKFMDFLWLILKIYKFEGSQGIRLRVMQRVGHRLARSNLQRFMPASIRALTDPMSFWMEEVKRDKSNKRLIVSDYSRDQLVQAYMAADLFVFASNIEYSPLVLFEAAASETAFLSVPVGNAEEITKWTGGGIICFADKDERGYTRADPKVLAIEIAKLIEEPSKLTSLGRAGHEAWKKRYTWGAIASQYEEILCTTSAQNTQMAEKCKSV